MVITNFTPLVVVENCQGLYEKNFLTNVGEFVNNYISEISHTFFTAGNIEADRKTFVSDLEENGYASWYVCNNDSMIAEVADMDHLVAFFKGELNEDVDESIFNNVDVDNNFVEDISNYLEHYYYYDKELSDIKVIEDAKDSLHLAGYDELANSVDDLFKGEIIQKYPSVVDWIYHNSSNLSEKENIIIREWLRNNIFKKEQ